MQINFKQINNLFRLSITLLGLLMLNLLIQAQPSGGPYGPVHQSYELPEVAGEIYYVATDGNAEASGKSLNTPITLESAIARVKTGDAIVMRGGIYRTGELIFNQGIIIQPYKDEQPVLKGTLVVNEGVALNGHVWRIPWKRLFPSKPLDWWRRDREGVKTPLHRFNNDMVFVDGEFLQSVGWEGEVNEKSYYIDYDQEQVYIGVDPAKHLVEITAWGSALVRTTAEVHGKVNDRKGPLIRGIKFTQYAWRGIEIEGKRSFGPTDEPTDEPVGPSDPLTYGKEVIGTTLENVTITYCSRVAGYFRGDSLTIRQSLFSDTSTEGVYVIGSSDVLLEKNIFRRNNIEKITGYFPSAVKIFNQSHRVTCRDNLVTDNRNSNGIWYDVGNEDGIFVNNRVQNSINGFFFEISKGALCAGNVFVDCDYGVYVLNSSDVEVWQNTFVNSAATFKRDNRRAGGHFGWHAATGPDVDQREGHVFAGNLLVSDSEFTQPLLQVIQSNDLCGELIRPQLAKLDGNVYIRSENPDSNSLVILSPVECENCVTEFTTLESLQKFHPEYETHGQSLKSDMSYIFKSRELNSYKLIVPLGESTSAILPSDEVLQLLGWNRSEMRMPGAYPVR